MTWRSTTNEPTDEGIRAPGLPIGSVDQVNEAYARVLASDVRYRFVIDTATLA